MVVFLLKSRSLFLLCGIYPYRETKQEKTMQQRHLNRRQYFCELAKTAREFYLDYLKAYITLTSDSRVLEIGCGEGGNLLPFAEMGCHVTGIDICQSRISKAQTFFTEYHRQGTFICQDFLLSEEPKKEERYDLVIVHDVIEHIEPSNKRDFLLHIKSFLKQNGIAFFGFPAWQNPFGGHQQISVGLASKLPFIHLLPKPLYTNLLRKSGATESNVSELMSIRASQMTVENFERLISEVDYTICQRTLWLINPHYKQKFHINPRHQWTFFANIPYLRNFVGLASDALPPCGSRFSVACPRTVLTRLRVYGSPSVTALYRLA